MKNVLSAGLELNIQELNVVFMFRGRVILQLASRRAADVRWGFLPF